MNNTNPQTHQARRALAEAVSRLLVNKPFYGYFLKNFVIVQANDETQTMGVGFGQGRIRCVYNTDFVLGLSPQQQEAVLIHEVLHVVHLHLTRRENRDHHIFNIACDMAINPKIAHLPKGVILPPKNWRTSNAEFYYDKLRDQKNASTDQGSSIGQPGNSGSNKDADRSSPYGNLIDDHAHWEEADGREWEVEGAVGRAIGDAHNKSRGQIPGDLRETIQWWLSRPQVSWRQMLRDFVHGHAPINRQSTYTRRNRRIDEFGLPGMHKHRAPRMAVAVDTSGSINEEELSLFFSELEGLTRETAPILMLFHTGVYTIRPYRKGDHQHLKKSIEWGGTDFLTVFECAEQNAPAKDGSKITDPIDGLIILTDGYAPYPSASHLPTLWVMSPDHNEQKPPFGRVAILENRNTQ